MIAAEDEGVEESRGMNVASSVTAVNRSSSESAIVKLFSATQEPSDNQPPDASSF